ncbi:hypothetical protein F383_26271 [Gossypium arboreum]|uniref:Uncharacterized protein n=1 Tax=Gossypium arboreum TaxID=29729 RepID=A0A0B0P5M6_GOSAR|nr:hypothetical protein F383_26271 [Gossypium arboreum]
MSSGIVIEVIYTIINLGAFKSLFSNLWHV